jgi:hypothetical protein
MHFDTCNKPIRTVDDPSRWTDSLTPLDAHASPTSHLPHRISHIASPMHTPITSCASLHCLQWPISPQQYPDPRSAASPCNRSNIVYAEAVTRRRTCSRPCTLHRRRNWRPHIREPRGKDAYMAIVFSSNRMTRMH